MAKKSYPSREDPEGPEPAAGAGHPGRVLKASGLGLPRRHVPVSLFRPTSFSSMQRPNATRVASAKRWKEQFERFINRGKKAIYIMAPFPIVKTVERQKLDPAPKRRCWTRTVGLSQRNGRCRCHGSARCRCSTCLRPTASPSHSWPRT